MLRIVLLYLILCITAILPVLSASGPDIAGPNHHAPEAYMGSIPFVPKADMGYEDEYTPEPQPESPSVNAELSHVRDVLLQQFITLRAQLVCEKHLDHGVSNERHARCLRCNIIFDVDVATGKAKPNGPNLITGKSTKALSQVRNKHLQDFILLRARTACNKPQRAGEKQKCLQMKILFGVKVARMVERDG